jgi:Domain of unknown function (DUF5615)
MKLLLDENLPKRLKEDFSNHEIYSIRDKGWNGVKNGELLKLMIAEKFDALLTFDKNLRYQQNLNKYTISVFDYNTYANTYEALSPLSYKILNYLKEERLEIGVYVISKD